MSEKAFGRIKYISNSPMYVLVYYKKKKERDLAVRRYYRQTRHEADITKFISSLDKRLKSHYKQTSLARFRVSAGFSQNELANRSGVNVRIIQSYEQRLRYINKAQLSTVVDLAEVLDCRPDDLMEK